MRALTRKMQTEFCNNPMIGEKMLALSQSLESAQGKKVYGYLKKSTKAQVDDIVDEIAKIPAVTECYAVWNQLRDKLESYYKDTPRQHLPLSQQKEFRAIKNLVIQEAENLRRNIFTFEDSEMAEEYADVLPADSDYDAVPDYYQAVEMLDDDRVTQAEKREALQTLERLWDYGFSMAAHHLGRAWRKGLGVLPDDEKAEMWFRRSAEEGNSCSQYSLGTLLQAQGRIEEAIGWYEQAAEAGNQTAQYHLGKLYLQGEAIPQNVTKAVEYLTAAAEQGNQYAQYALGKLHLTGREIPQDKELAAADAVCRAGKPVRTIPFGASERKSVAICTPVSHSATPPHEPGLPGGPSTFQSGEAACGQQADAENQRKENCYGSQTG